MNVNNIIGGWYQLWGNDCTNYGERMLQTMGGRGECKTNNERMVPTMGMIVQTMGGGWFKLYGEI